MVTSSYSDIMRGDDHVLVGGDGLGDAHHGEKEGDQDLSCHLTKV